MLLIGEVSKISQVSLRMLRYYDKNDLFKPKVIDEENGYRYYTAEQLDDLYRIVELRDLGFSVAEMKELLKQKDREMYLQAIERKNRELEAVIRNAQLQKEKLAVLKSGVNERTSDSCRDMAIVTKQIPEKQVISYRKTVANYFCEGTMWKELTELLQPLGYDDASECFSLYHDADYREENVDIELCVVCGKEWKELPDQLTYRTVPGCENAASLLVKGDYANISGAYRKFAFWLEKHSVYRMGGPTRQICHVSPQNTDNPEEYVTEILIPLIPERL